MINLEAIDPQVTIADYTGQDFRCKSRACKNCARKNCGSAICDLKNLCACCSGNGPVRRLLSGLPGGGTALLSQAWDPTLGCAGWSCRRWVWAICWACCWRNLDAQPPPGGKRLLPSLGWGNRLTLLRGVLVGGMLGFLFLPRPAGLAGLDPGHSVHACQTSADFFDGYVARVTDHATRLGEILDMSFDGLGVLVASVLAVQYGQAPAWYLLVGAARYLFLAGEWLRRRLGRPIYPIPPSLNRRVFAGLQMGFLAAVLLPLISAAGDLDRGDAVWLAAAGGFWARLAVRQRSAQEPTGTQRR